MPNRHTRSILFVDATAKTRSLRCGACLILSIVSSSSVDAGDIDVWQSGFWKSPPVPRHAIGEFGNQDPYGLSIGVRIETDCSIYWISPETNKLYCFNSLTSKSFFIDNPTRYIRAAEAFLSH